VKIAIDDFGTGFSSLGYLRRLPVQRIKIDRSFIAELTSSEHDAAIVQGILWLAHRLGLKVLAEGVETTAQRDFLSAQQCDEFQGYLFARPMPAPALQDFLQQHEPGLGRSTRSSLSLR
jgi:EAL domain-containing protein (putative c-di-GMP-specific phosphodiesterase class I)